MFQESKLHKNAVISVFYSLYCGHLELDQVHTKVCIEQLDSFKVFAQKQFGEMSRVMGLQNMRLWRKKFQSLWQNKNLILNSFIVSFRNGKWNEIEN